MTFLQLCQRLVSESGGLSGSGPSTVVSQTGEYAKVVNWIASAWVDIQRLRQDWRWMNRSFSLTLSASDAVYTAADAGITSLRSWDRDSIKLYQTSVADELFLTYLPYEQFRAKFLFGTQSTNRPDHFTIQPDNSLRFGWVPNDTYYVTGQYWQAPVTLSADGDTPAMPSHFHDMIWQLALTRYAVSDAAGEIYAGAMAEYKRMLRELELDQLPELSMWSPLV